MKQLVLRFGLMAAALLLLMQVSKYTLIAGTFSFEVFVTLFAILFLSFGYLVSKALRSSVSTSLSPSPVVPSNSIEPKNIEQFNISKREYEVLQLIDSGYSNLEISQRLFISESTVKTHVSNLLQKLNAKRRTQAVQKARELQIL